MEELNKKVIGNAAIAYFFGIVWILFYLSKNPNIKHPFVLSHVKSAFFLHTIMLLTIYIMSYPFLRTIHVLGYSLNTIITASLCLIIFSWILYGAYMAHKWKRVTLGEIFHKTGASKNLITTSRTEKIEEENSLILILSHIPFFGYIIYPRHKQLDHIRDISQLNFIVTLISTFIFIIWYNSLASLIMLAYIIYSVYQAVRLSTQGDITTLNLNILPTVGEKYILQKSLISYVWNNLHKNAFTPLSQIIEEKTLKHKNQQIKDEASLVWKQNFHMRNNIVLIGLFIMSILVFTWDSPLLILFLFPLCYAIWYKDIRAYRMPYIYDIYVFLHSIYSRVWSIFHKTRKLQKTQIQETIKMWENTEEQKK
jgi:hypothetical protein